MPDSTRPATPEEERIALEAMIRLMMSGAEMLEDVSGAVRVQAIRCPYCGQQSASLEEAKEHDGACEAHPAMIRLRAVARRAVEIAEREQGAWKADPVHIEAPVVAFGIQQVVEALRGEFADLLREEEKRG